MPNDLRRSFSALFSRGAKERNSERRSKEDPNRPRIPKNEPTQLIQPQPPVSFNDDYVDPLDLVKKEDSKYEPKGTYDEPWDSSAHRANQANLPNPSHAGQSYDTPWDTSTAENPRGKIQAGMTYDEPWDRTGNLSAHSGTISTLSSHSSSTSHHSFNSRPQLYRPPVLDSHKTTRDQFKPDPRLVVDPNFVAENTKVEYEVPPPPQTPPHRRARSLVPKLQIVKDELIRVPSPNMRPARSHDSLSAANGSRVTSSDLPNVPPTPGIFESPLNFHKRQSSQPTDAIGSSAYLQQLLRQNDGHSTNSLDDLLYGSNKGAPQRRPPAFDESWARPGQNFHAHSQSDAAYRPPTDLNDSFYSQVPVRSRSAKSQIRKKHSLSPHRPHMTTSTMIKSLQSEFNHSQTTSSSTGRSTGSEVSHSSMLSPRNQLELLDQMDYYRSTMTRNEAEKILAGEPEGSFVVRRNTQNCDWYSLSVVTGDQGVLHLLIQDVPKETSNGSFVTLWQVGGNNGASQAEFPSVPELILFYQSNSLNIRGTKGLTLTKSRH